jgi:hypothetical protein
LRHLSRRVVRVKIGQKPGVVRGTGSSNPSPSTSESSANQILYKSVAQFTRPRFIRSEAVRYAGSSFAPQRMAPAFSWVASLRGGSSGADAPKRRSRTRPISPPRDGKRSCLDQENEKPRS